jgi:transketolase
MHKLNDISKIIRKKIIYLSYKAKTAHLASSLSCVDIIVVIYEKFLKFNENKKENNIFILSKGHAATALYSILNYKKIITDKLFESYSKKDSILEEHPTHNIPGVSVTTGSLGHGLSVGCGIALGFKIKKLKNKVYVLLSDGECNEGSVWEAVLFASSNKLNNLIVIVDYNKWQATGKTKNILNLGDLKKKFQTFGFNSRDVNGHNFNQIIKNLKNTSLKKPLVIIAHTIKGKGVTFMEDDNNWHYRSPNEKEYQESIKQLDN